MALGSRDALVVFLQDVDQKEQYGQGFHPNNGILGKITALDGLFQGIDFLFFFWFKAVFF